MRRIWLVLPFMAVLLLTGCQENKDAAPIDMVDDLIDTYDPSPSEMESVVSLLVGYVSPRQWASERGMYTVSEIDRALRRAGESKTDIGEERELLALLRYDGTDVKEAVETARAIQIVVDANPSLSFEALLPTCAARWSYFSSEIGLDLLLGCGYDIAALPTKGPGACWVVRGASDEVTPIPQPCFGGSDENDLSDELLVCQECDELVAAINREGQWWADSEVGRACLFAGLPRSSCQFFP